MKVNSQIESREVSPFPAGDHKAQINSQVQRHSKYKIELEDLTVVKRSPDLLNNVKIGQDQLRLIMKHILFYGGCDHSGQVTLNNLMNTPSNSPVNSEGKMFR